MRPQPRAFSLNVLALSLAPILACGGASDHGDGSRSEHKPASHSGLPPSGAPAHATPKTVATATPASAIPASEKMDPPAADPAAESDAPGELSLAKIAFAAPFDGDVVATATLDGGLVVDDFVIGQGEEAADGSTVEVHYTGYLLDGSVFDSSVPRNRAFEFPLGAHRVIQAWDKGVKGMKVGGKRRLTCPPALAYGDRSAGKIPPGSTLVFTIDLLGVQPPPAPPKTDEAFTGKPVHEEKRENGLELYDFAAGTGPVSKAGDTLVVHYTGKLDDGSVFDSSVTRNQPFTFPLGQGRVIKGWDEGMAGMKVGGLRKLVIPAELGYGERNMGKIPPNSRLTFTVEVMAIKSP